MDKIQSDFFRDMIIRYNSFPSGKEKDNLRNLIYEKMLPWMKKWISAIMAKKGLFLPKEEILSRSWDCFEFCLRKFKPHNKEIAVPNHFYSYSEFYLRTYFGKKSNINQFTEIQFDKIDPDFHPEKIYTQLDHLKSFRDLLDAEHAFVFDDALMSMVPSNQGRQYRIEESSLSPIRYQESKKIFKIVIDFLLRQG